MAEHLPIPVAGPLSAAQQSLVVNLMRRAARSEILPRFRRLHSADITTKDGADDLVTDADTGAEAMIGRGLARAFPGALIVGEESVAARPELRDEIAESDFCFVIDPVDGTWNFARGLPLFGIILSVCRFGKPVFGILYDAVMDDWMIADDSGPARHVLPGQRDRTLRVSRGGTIDQLTGFVPLWLMPEDRRARMAACLPEFRRVTALRCSCHEYRMLASGAVDFCLSGALNPWDHAAGVRIVQQAGGYAAMLDGSDYDAGRTAGHVLCAPDPDTWARLRDRFAFLVE